MNPELVAGVDEAGRGALAGPVVAGAVIFPVQCKGLEFQDSKKISDTKRRQFFQYIQAQCVFGIGVVSAGEIDQIGIKKATHKAMRKAVDQLSIPPKKLLVDGNDQFLFSCPSQSIIRGDEIHQVISAASIVAKVVRDDIMKQMHTQYPNFDFVHNKGYGVPKHLELLEQEIYCPEHRCTYDPLFTCLTQGRLF